MASFSTLIVFKSQKCLRQCSKRKLGGGVLLGGLGIFSNNNSGFDRPYDEEELKRSYSNRESLTYKDRLDLMWRKDEFENFSPELQECTNISITAGLFGFLIGGYSRSRTAFNKFVAENKHEMFRHPREAQLAVADRVFLSMFRGGASVGWRCALITVMYSFGTCTCDVLRNHIQPLDHAAVGFGAAALYKTLSGPRAMLAAGAIGAALGLFEGCSSWGLMKLSGETFEDKWNRKFQYLDNTNSKVIEERRKAAAKAIPRATWSANPEEENPNEKAEEEEKNSFRSYVLFVLRRIKDLISINIESK